MANVLHNIIVVSSKEDVNQQAIEKRHGTKEECKCKSELAHLKNEYFQMGYEQGREKGITEGISLEKRNKHAEKNNLTTLLKSLIKQVPSEISSLREDLRQDIAHIVLSIVQPIFVQRQLDRSWLFKQINQILTQLNHRQEVELILHPEDIEQLQAHKIHLKTAHLRSLKICSDDQIFSGGCRIKTQHGLFEISIEKQLQQLREKLMNIQPGEYNV